MQKIVHYSIADLTVSIEGNDSMSILEQLSGFGEFITDNSNNVDIRIILDSNLDLANKERFTQLKNFVVDGTEHIFWAGEKELLFQLISSDDSIDVLQERGSSEIRLSSCTSALMLRFALWAAYSMVAIESGVVPIHASSVEHKGYAMLSLGESGTGKSTHSNMWLESIPDTRPFNDDSPMLRMQAGTLYTYGSPWSGKRAWYVAKRYPAKAIVRIVRDQNNSIERLNAINSIAAVYPSLPPMFALDKALSAKLLDIVSKVYQSTPIYRLKCRPDHQAAAVNYNESFKNS